MTVDTENPFRPPIQDEIVGSKSDFPWWPAPISSFLGFCVAVSYVASFDAAETLRILERLLAGSLFFTGWGILIAGFVTAVALRRLTKCSSLAFVVLSGPISAVTTLVIKYLLDGHLK